MFLCKGSNNDSPDGLSYLIYDGTDGGGVGEIDEVDVEFDGDPEEERRVRAPPLRPLHPHQRLYVVPRRLVVTVFRLEDVALKEVLVQILGSFGL